MFRAHALLIGLIVAPPLFAESNAAAVLFGTAAVVGSTTGIVNSSTQRVVDERIARIQADAQKVTTEREAQSSEFKAALESQTAMAKTEIAAGTAIATDKENTKRTFLQLATAAYNRGLDYLLQSEKETQMVDLKRQELALQRDFFKQKIGLEWQKLKWQMSEFGFKGTSNLEGATPQEKLVQNAGETVSTVSNIPRSNGLQGSALARGSFSPRNLIPGLFQTIKNGESSRESRSSPRGLASVGLRRHISKNLSANSSQEEFTSNQYQTHQAR
jgi:hypothetical protein